MVSPFGWVRRTGLVVATAVALALVPGGAAPAHAEAYVSTFSPTGERLATFPVGLAEGQIVSLLRRDSADRIYVGRFDNGHGAGGFNPNDMIAMFDAAGNLLDTYKGDTRAHSALTFDSLGNLYFGASEEGGPLADDIYQFSSAGAELNSFGSSLADYADMVTAPADRIFALVTNSFALREFTTAGVEQNVEFVGSRVGRFLALDEDGDSLWAYAPINGEPPPGDFLIQFDLDLNEIGSIDLTPFGNPIVGGLRVNAAGELLVLMYEGPHILVLDTTGAVQRTIPLQGLSEAWRLELTSSGDFLVTHETLPFVVAIPTADSLGLAVLALALLAAALALVRRQRPGIRERT